MDFYITKDEIVKSLNLTLGVVEKRQTLPIISNVLIEVDESSLKLTATDLESEISTTSTISNFKSGGKTTAPARKLNDLCRLLPDMTPGKQGGKDVAVLFSLPIIFEIRD